jgi:anthranilate synthase/aminodeoxychorismate synthase-like glutamine amidotransferase
MVLMIDNYDSFTYNLVQYLRELGQEVTVYRNDKITLEEVQEMAPRAIVVSPGPGTPKEAGISVELIRRFAGKVPILGVCLGHQAIGYAFGGRIVHAKVLMHGKTSRIFHDGETIFRGVDNPFQATRYHSLALDMSPIQDAFELSAWTDGNEVMGIRHRSYAVEGVQFHPESILTAEGKKILQNFLAIAENSRKGEA